MIGARGSSAPRLPDGVKEALALLLEAHELAQDSGDDVWDYAVEIETLRGAGITNSGLRWLVRKGWAAHRLESARPTKGNRNLQASPNGLTLSDRTCFALTEVGVKNAIRILEDEPEQTGAESSRQGCDGDTVPPNDRHPHWNATLRELRDGDTLVKQFTVPAPNQEALLSTFEDDGWRSRIDDPLPPKPGIDPKQRLRDAVRCLNRNQRVHLLHFRADGTGTGVCWQYVQTARRAKKMTGPSMDRPRIDADRPRIARGKRKRRQG